MNGQTQFGRHHFHRKSICDARLELLQIDAWEKIIEACLLTAIGTLGVTCGFSSIFHPEKKTVKIVSRGVDKGTIAYVQTHFQTLLHEHFPVLDTVSYPFHADLRVAEFDPDFPFELDEADVRIWIGWRIGKQTSGIIGLGPKIISDAYADDEVNFLLNLTDNMIFAMQSRVNRRMVQTLKKDLDKAIFRSRDLALGMDEARHNQDHTLFRLSGFNDIFNELSALKESTAVIDSFLLVLLGIFGAGGGYIFYLDTAMEKGHMTCRNLDPTTDQPMDWICAGVCHAVVSTRALQLEPMQAVILSEQQMDCFKPFLPHSSIGLIFQVDDTAMGVVGLGERLVQVPYGAKECEMFLAFVRNFLVFLKNTKSFETIQRLHAEQEKKNIELETSIKALSDSSQTIAGLEMAGERIKTAISKTMAQSRKVSVKDIALILAAGIVLGLLYNFASPGGIHIVPKSWLRPPNVHVDIDQAKTLLTTQNALFVDARPAEFFSQGHIAGSENLSPALFDFVYMMHFNQVKLDRPIVVYGRNISRRYDEETAFRLLERGHERVVVFAGGEAEWAKQGMELEQ